MPLRRRDRKQAIPKIEFQFFPTAGHSLSERKQIQEPPPPAGITHNCIMLTAHQPFGPEKLFIYLLNHDISIAVDEAIRFPITNDCIMLPEFSCLTPMRLYNP